MRINARLDDSYKEKFFFIEQDEGKSRTMILKEALDQYFANKLEAKKLTIIEKNKKILEMVGGIASGSEDLSVNYKQHLYQGLKLKHDID